ncbi:Uncharacterised protein [Mycobacteroides abscessus subsp. abscessus]|nr:Uncharacterised protein [Mycobacteroides abscessus subsp. abscessus]
MAELCDRFLDHALQCGPVSDIGLLGDDLAPGRLDEPDGFLEVFGCRCLVSGVLRYGSAGVDRDDVRAGLSQPHGVLSSLSTGRTGYEGHFSGQGLIRHVTCSFAVQPRLAAFLERVPD